MCRFLYSKEDKNRSQVHMNQNECEPVLQSTTHQKLNRVTACTDQNKVRMSRICNKLNISVLKYERNTLKLWKFLTAMLCLMCAGTVLTQAGDRGELLDPNLVESEVLQRLPHVNEDIAEAIVAGRPYLTAAQFDEVLAEFLDRKQREAVYARLFRQVNLNSASRSEIMVIPGMDSRMAHEFEEYRPYASLEQFRREIGKYVDEEEVARLEQYVFIPMDLNEATSDDFETIPGMTKRMVHEFEEYRPYKSIEQFRREIGKYVDEAEVARLESYITIE